MNDERYIRFEPVFEIRTAKPLIIPETGQQFRIAVSKGSEKYVFNYTKPIILHQTQPVSGEEYYYKCTSHDKELINKAMKEGFEFFHDCDIQVEPIPK